MELGENISGGRRPCRLEIETPWTKTLLLTENSMFGSSIAPYRHGIEKKYVKSMFHAAYRKEVFEKVGFFNENLGRTEDNEMHYRMRKAGYRFCFNSDIVSYQNVRNTLPKMLKQKYSNGYWIGLTVGVCPSALSLYHFVPFGFVFGIIVTTILACLKLPQLAILMWVLYGLCNLFMFIDVVRQNQFSKFYLLLPSLFFLLHVSYGIGTLVGFIKIPFWNKNCR